MTRHSRISRLCLLFALAPISTGFAADKPTEKEALDATGGNRMSYTEKRLLDLVAKQQAILQRYEGKEELESYELDDLTFRLQKLAEQYESIIDDGPGDVTAYLLYGKLLRQIGDTEKAVEMFLKANEIDPELPVVKQQLGNYMAEHGKYAQALGFFMQALVLAPEEPLYHYQMGEVLATFRKEFIAEGLFTASDLDEEMQEAFAAAAKLAPGNRDFAYRYAESFYDVADPDWEKALAAWEALRESAESSLDADAVTLHRANVYFSMGRFEDSRALADTVKTPALDYSKNQLLDQLNKQARVEVIPDTPAETN